MKTYYFTVRMLPKNKKATAFEMVTNGTSMRDVIDRLENEYCNHFVKAIDHLQPPKPKHEYEVTFIATAECAHDIKQWFGSNVNRTDDVDMTMPTKIALL